MAERAERVEAERVRFASLSDPVDKLRVTPPLSRLRRWMGRGHGTVFARIERWLDKDHPDALAIESPPLGAALHA